MKDCKRMRSLVSFAVYDEEECKGEGISTGEYASYWIIIGSVLYSATYSRPDFEFAAQLLGAYVSAPTTMNMAEEEQALRYLQSTKDKISEMKPCA